MQGIALAGLTIAVGNTEAVETAAGLGLRVSSRQQLETKNPLFTEILNHKGASLAIQAETGLSAGEENAGCSGDADEGSAENADVCSLLMQLLLMNNAAGVQQEHSQSAASTNPGVTSSAIDQLTAATVTLQNGEAQAAVLPVQAEADTETVTPSEAVLTEGKQEISPAFGEKLMAAMTKATQDQLIEEDVATAENISDARNLASAEAGKAVSDTAAQASTGLQKSAFAQTVIAAGQNSNVIHGQRGETDNLQAQAKETNGGLSDTFTGRTGQAEDAVVTGVTSTAEEQADGGMGELLSDEDTGATDFKDESGAAILNRTYTQTANSGDAYAEKAAAVEKAFQTFVDEFRSLEAGVNEVKIVLEPESLGVMTITVVRTENGISAKIKADDQQVCEAISDQIHKLISSLESRGIQVKEMEVTYGQTDQNTGGSAQQSFSGGREGNAGEQNMPRDDSQRTDDWQENVSIPEEADMSVSPEDMLLEYRI